MAEIEMYGTRVDGVSATKTFFRLGESAARNLSGPSVRTFGGEFGTLAQAVKAAQAEPSCDRIVETIPCVKRGIEYGFRSVIRNVRGEVIR